MDGVEELGEGGEEGVCARRVITLLLIRKLCVKIGHFVCMYVSMKSLYSMLISVDRSQE